MSDKRPRQHAHDHIDIINLPTSAERHAALDAVLKSIPEQDRAAVAFYIRDAYARKHKTKLPDYKDYKVKP